MEQKIEINNIYNMDCMEGMSLIAKQYGASIIDCILTSPPYNTARPNTDLKTYVGRYDLYDKEKMSNKEYCGWTIDLFKYYEKILKPNGKILYNLSYGAENTECMPLVVAAIIENTPFTLADIIVWEKNSALPNNMSPNKLTRICEFIYVFCRKDEIDTYICNKKVISLRESGQKNYENIFNKINARNNDETCPYNKATFSTELCFKLMNIYCKENECILDTFMGTGTTAVACIKSNRNYIGFELSKKQCEWAQNRIDNCNRMKTLFDYE